MVDDALNLGGPFFGPGTPKGDFLPHGGRPRWSPTDFSKLTGNHTALWCRTDLLRDNSVTLQQFRVSFEECRVWSSAWCRRPSSRVLRAKASPFRPLFPPKLCRAAETPPAGP
jgi:hypothetical protein